MSSPISGYMIKEKRNGILSSILSMITVSSMKLCLFAKIDREAAKLTSKDKAILMTMWNREVALRLIE